MFPTSVTTRLSNYLRMVGPLTTMVVTPWFNYDPINLGKALVLSSLAFGSIGLLLPYLREFRHNIGSSLLSISIFFVCALISPLFFSKAPLSQQIWGQFGRATGVVTYVSLLFLFIAASTLRSHGSFEKLIHSLVFTQSFMTIYCFFQLIGKDPIKWSSFATFGTLGNVNFLSGFMGIASVSSIILATRKSLKISIRMALLCMSLFDIYIVATTDSIQGLVAFSIGIASYFAFVTRRKGLRYFVSYLAFFVFGFLSLIAALLNIGPLKSFVFQATVLYRADYMQAGLKMMMHHPLTGVGIDSYDDWYRYERGIVSAFRTSLNRTANTAHNIMIDLGAGGGIPLLLAYLLLIGLILHSIVRGVKRGLSEDIFFVILICSWIAYQVQASVSINQIGVGVWGWLLGGAIIGFERMNLRDQTKSTSDLEASVKRGKKSTKVPNMPPPLAVLGSAVGIALGFTLTVMPFKADLDFRSASSKGRLEEMMQATLNPATNVFFLSQTNNSALQNNFQDQARIINERLISKFPRNIYGWKARMSLTSLSDSERQETLKRIDAIDPFLSICADPNAPMQIRKLLLKLPSEQQRELAQGWGLLPKQKQKSKSFSLASLETSGLNERLNSYCRG